VADHVIATNQSYRLIEMQRDSVPEERITIVRNGPDISRSQPVDADLSISQPGKINIGYVGVMGFQDGVDYLLRALHYLIYEAERKDIYCVLMGKGDALDHLQALAQELGLADYVRFTGWVDHARIGGYLAAMDLCVAPEPSNTYNDHSTMIKLTEYMAAGKSIVAFDLPEHRFTAQNAALYAPNNDPVELAKLILVLADDPEKRESMGRIGRQRIETQLAWSYQADNLLKVYESLSIALAKRQSVFSRGSSL
jgi:glycosyltransferase involved in cell wall biosynthesis